MQMNFKQKIVLLGLSILVFIVDMIIIHIIVSVIKSDYKKQTFITGIKSAMMRDGTLTEDDIAIIDEYSFDQNKESPHTEYDGWTNTDSQLAKLCKFGFKVLENYYTSDQSHKYLKIAEDIISRIDKAIMNVVLHHGVLYGKQSMEKHRKIHKIEFIWSNNWYTFSVYITRLMLMYEYLGENECIKRHLCHKHIQNLVTSINISLNKIREDVNIVYIGLPHILSNYLYDYELYEKEKKSSEYRELCSVFYIDHLRNTDNVENGMYEDGSYIFHYNVATYSYIVTLNGFYENLFIAMNEKYNLREKMTILMKKLLHPSIPYVTLGLFGRDGSRISKNWWDVHGELGIALMPFIGLGLFKSENFMFSVRVQRSKIAAYETDRKANGEFALGWVQLRKLYLQGHHYSNPITWEILKNEPGILSIVGENYKQLPPSKENVKSYFCDDIQSYIGRLIDHDLLFWRNDYRFTDVYNCFIVEMGVITNNGLEIYYRIDNSEDKSLQFRLLDNDIKNSDEIKSTIEIFNSDGTSVTQNVNTENAFIEIGPQSVSAFTWRTIFNSNNIVIEKYDNTKKMKFHHYGLTYTVEPLQDNNLYYTVSCNDKNGNIKYVIGGSCRSTLNDEMNYGGKKLTRDRSTCMYFE